MLNKEQSEMMNVLVNSQSLARLSTAVGGAAEHADCVSSPEGLLAMLSYSAVEVIKSMDNDEYDYKTKEAEANHVALMALVFSMLFGSVERFASITRTQAIH